MAWLYKYKGSANWWIGFRLNGKVAARTTGTADRGKAEEQLTGVEALASAGRNGRPLDALYHALKAQSGQATPTRSLRSELDDWIAESRKSAALATAIRYGSIAEGFAKFMNATPAKPLLRDVNTEHVRSYLAAVLERKSVSTANQERRCLRVFWRRAIANGRCETDSVAAIKAFRDTAESKRRPITLDQVRLILTKAEGFWRFAVLTGFYTGLRISDIAAMPVGAVDLKENLIRLAAKKTGTRVTLPIPDVLASEINARLMVLGKTTRATDPLWPEHAAMRSGQRANEFYALLVKCGLVQARTHKATKKGRDAARESVGISFHCLRHAFVSNLKAAGAGQAVARALAGHSSDTMSDHYTSLPLQSLRDAVHGLPDVTAKR